MTPILTPLQTTIIHSVRQALGISFEEYVVANAIEFICNYKKNKSGVASGKYREAIAEFAGISTRTVDRAILNLKNKGLIRQVTRQSVEITSLWQESLANKVNSRHFGASDENITHAILAQESRHFGASAYIIYIHKKHKICPKLPFLTNFQTSFLNDFKIFGFEAPTISFESIKKISKNGGDKIASKKNTKTTAQNSDTLFEEFYTAYPRKEKKAMAAQRYRKLAGKHKDIMSALAAYKEKIETEGIQKQFIKLPTTFLTDYEDYLPSPAEPQNNTKGDGEPDIDIDEDGLEAAKSTVRMLAAILARTFQDPEARRERVKGSAFELVDKNGARIFNDDTAAMVEEMGGTWAAILEVSSEYFDARAKMAWTKAKSKSA